MSLPNIPVSTAPAKGPAVSTAPAGNFLAALMNATQGTSNPGATPNIATGSPSNGKGTVANKESAKSAAKPSAPEASRTAQPPVPDPHNDDVAKLLANTPIPSALVLTVQPDDQSSDSDSATDGTYSNDVKTPGSNSDVQAVAAGSSLVFSESVTSPANSAQSGFLAPVSQVIGDAEAPSVHLADESNAVASEAGNQKFAIGQDSTTTSSAKPAKNSSNGASLSVPVPATPNVEAKPTVHLQMPIAAPVETKQATPDRARRLTVESSAATSAPLAPPQPANIKPEVLQQAQLSQPAAGKSDSGIVPPSSASKKDGDAAKNPPPSDQADSAVSAPSVGSKANVSNAAATVSGATTQAVVSAHSVDGAQATSPVIDSKTLAESPAVKPDASKAPAQAAPGSTEAEPVAETAGHLSSPFQVARLVERAGQTEFRVGIQAGELGNVDIRTSMSHSQLSAEISVDRSELGRALTAELPNLHNRLAEQRVPVANIVLQDQSSGSNSGGGDFRQGSAHKQYGDPSREAASQESEPSVASLLAGANESSTGIDIHM